MTRTLLISTALLACACSRDAQRPQANPDLSASAASAQSAGAPQPTATAGNDSVSLIGCLQGDGRFTLTNATAESRASGSVPAITTGSTVALESVPTDARSHVNKQVRVTGHFGAARPDAAARTPSPSGGSTSTRDDVRANSTTVAGDTPEPASGRRLIVERVNVIAGSCATR